MDYIEKEERLLQAYKDKDFDRFGVANDFYDFTGDQLSKFPSYASIAVRERQMAPIRNMRYAGQELHGRVQGPGPPYRPQRRNRLREPPEPAVREGGAGGVHGH